MKGLSPVLVAVFIVTNLASECTAQTPVTVTLRSGQSLSVELIGLRVGVLTVRRSNRELLIHVDGAAALSFVGGQIPDSHWDLVTLNHHLLVLRNGHAVQGRLHEVEGASPSLVRFGDDNRGRDYAVEEVAWILIAPRTAQPGPPGASIDLNGIYLGPSSEFDIGGAVTSATTDPRGDRRGEGQVYEVERGMRVPEGTYTPFSDDSRRPTAISAFDLRGKSFVCNVDLHARALWQHHAEFFQLGVGRQADPGDTGTEEVFVFMYRDGERFALYMETDWDLYRPDTTYYAASDETRFRIRVAVDPSGTEAQLAVTPLNGTGAGTEHIVAPLLLDLRNDEVRRASFFAGFTQNLPDVISKAAVTLDDCRHENGAPEAGRRGRGQGPPVGTSRDFPR